MVTKGVPFKRIMDEWNRRVGGTNVRRIRNLSKTRRDNLRKRWAEWSELGDPWKVFGEICAEILASPFLRGSKGWTVYFDFVIENDTHWLKIAEGSYGEETESERVKRVLEKK